MKYGVRRHDEDLLECRPYARNWLPWFMRCKWTKVVMVADELANGRLQRVLPLWQGVPGPVYAMTETRLLPAKTRRFIELLRERLGQG
jgi:DNA-binding transcriptional LysR family regulator